MGWGGSCARRGVSEVFFFFIVLLRDVTNISYKYSLNQTCGVYFITQVESFFGGVMLPLFLHL